MKKAKINKILGLLFFIPTLSFSQDIFADYKIHFDKVHLTNYVQTINDNFKVTTTENGSLAITDSGYFKIHDSGGRQINVTLKDGVINGQTLFNLRRKIQGNVDSPLTPLGIRQAETAVKSNFFIVTS